MSLELAETLRNPHVEREPEAMQKGWGNLPSEVFCDDQGENRVIANICEKGKDVSWR
jgi:hypothetical protein